MPISLFLGLPLNILHNLNNSHKISLPTYLIIHKLFLNCISQIPCRYNPINISFVVKDICFFFLSQPLLLYFCFNPALISHFGCPHTKSPKGSQHLSFSFVCLLELYLSYIYQLKQDQAKKKWTEGQGYDNNNPVQVFHANI